MGYLYHITTHRTACTYVPTHQSSAMHNTAERHVVKQKINDVFRKTC